MQFLGADAYFGTESELRSVGEGRRYVGIDACRIHPFLELPNRVRIFGNDRFAVARRVSGNVGEGLVQ